MRINRLHTIVCSAVAVVCTASKGVKAQNLKGTKTTCLAMNNMMMMKVAGCRPAPTSPTRKPTVRPTRFPTRAPTAAPTKAPTPSPTDVPTLPPTASPTKSPTSAPSSSPTISPAPTSAPTITCPGIAGKMTLFNNHLYAYVGTLRLWDDADTYAKSLTCCGVQGHLVTITTSEEKAIVDTLSASAFWIGLNDKVSEGTYVWVTNEPFDASLFPVSPGPKDTSDCVIRFSNTLWFSSTCDGSAGGNSVVGNSVVEFDCP